MQSYYSGSKLFTPGPKFLLWIQGYYSGSKVTVQDPKLLLRIQSYNSGSKVFTLSPELLLLIQSSFSGSKGIIPDPKFLLWIQRFYFRSNDPIQFNIPKLEFEHVTSISPFNVAAAQGEEVEDVTFPSFSIWSLS